MSRRRGIMLCYPFEEKRLAKWSKPYIVQPKLDGVRCRSEPFEDSTLLLSSEENVFYHMEHIHEELKQLPINEYDGELYQHNLPFEDILSITSREVNPHPLRKVIEYHIFDIINTEAQVVRSAELLELSTSFNHLKYVKFVRTEIAWSFEQVWEFYEQFLSDGYEGIIVREAFSYYKRSRSTSIMKFKPKKSDTYKVVGYQEEVSKDGVPKNALGALILTDDEGNQFNVGSGFTSEDRSTMWASRDSLPGKRCTISYQHITSGKGVPRFPVFIEVIG